MTASLPSTPSSNPTPVLWRWLVLAGMLIILDQLTKLYFDGLLRYGQRIAVLPFFDFTLLYNPGAAFSF